MLNLIFSNLCPPCFLPPGFLFPSLPLNLQIADLQLCDSTKTVVVASHEK